MPALMAGGEKRRDPRRWGQKRGRTGAAEAGMGGATDKGTKEARGSEGATWLGGIRGEADTGAAWPEVGDEPRVAEANRAAPQGSERGGRTGNTGEMAAVRFRSDVVRRGRVLHARGWATWAETGTGRERFGPKPREGFKMHFRLKKC